MLEPQEGECLVCFVERALAGTPCDRTRRWAGHFREVRVPGAVGLDRRLDDVGAGCDCAIRGRGYRLVRELCERDLDTDELREPVPLPPCAGVRRTSARPCTNWVRHHRWDAVTW